MGLRCVLQLQCKVVLQDWSGSKPDFVLVGEQLDEVDRISYLGGCIPPDCRISDEVSPRVQKARLVFTSLRYLWH